MSEYTIGITTFEDRFDMLYNLIYQIRKQTNFDILIAINGKYNCNFSNEYRKKILNLCLQYDNIYPIFFPEQRGLSKLWNTLCIHSKHDWVAIFNDDIEIYKDDVFFYLGKNIDNSYFDLCRINGSFSHFAIHKNIIDEIGYFDERLLGFGEEDGDIIYRYIDKYKKGVSEWGIDGIKNLVTWIRDENIRPGISKYSAFNREFIFNSATPKYVPNESGIDGMFGIKHLKMIEDEKQYPYESFFKKNKNSL